MGTYHLPLRIVRIQVEENKYECLLTNLDSEEFPPELLKELYHLRWGVEDAFRKLKYALSVLDVHSKKAVCVEQELFGRMLLYNYTQHMLNYVNETREASPDNKRDYRPSFTKGAGHVRRYFNGTITLDEMLAYMVQELEAIRPGRKQPRKMTPKKPRDTHYRPAGG